MPPSGPTTTSTSPASGRATPASGSVASSCSTKAAADLRTRVATSAVVAVGASTGRRVRRDCLVAATSTASHLRRAFSPRSPRHCTTLRDACHGTTSSTPHSVAASTAWSSRSFLARACTSTNRGLGSGSLATETTRRSSVPAPTATTSPSTRSPAPSVSSRCSPTRVRRTVAACRPSGPSSTDAPRRPPAPRRALGGQEVQRQGHRALKASRSLPKIEPSAGFAMRPSGRSSPRAVCQLAQQLLLRGVEPGGRLHHRVHDQVAATGARAGG